MAHALTVLARLRGVGGGVRAGSRPGTLPPGRWDLASRRQEAGARPELSKWPVRALHVVPGGGLGGRSLEPGSGHGAGWDPGSGAWPSALI